MPPVVRTAFSTIPTDHYEELKENALFLQCLREAGVDNWEGFHQANLLYQAVTNGEDLH